MLTLTLDDINENWARDAEIDREQLGHESLRGPLLHAKYFKEFGQARLRLKRAQAKLKQLSQRKFTFFTHGPTKETQALGWALPPQGKILKGDAREMVECDPEIVELSLEVADLGERVDLLDGIIKAIKDRGFAIRNAIDWVKFQHGQ